MACRGTRLTDATGVLFGTRQGANFSVVSDRQVEATTPADVGPAVVDVTVQHPLGDMTIADGYAYFPRSITRSPRPASGGA